jgi:hypothetical protein
MGRSFNISLHKWKVYIKTLLGIEVTILKLVGQRELVKFVKGCKCIPFSCNDLPYFYEINENT